MNATKLTKRLKSLVLGTKSLQNILITLEENKIKFTTTNLDVTTTIIKETTEFYPDKIQIVVEYSVLLPVISSLPKNSSVDFEINGKLKIVSDYLTSEISYQSKDNFPNVENYTEIKGSQNTIKNKSIQGMIDIVPFIAKDSELRAALTGAYFDASRNNLVATNGHILAITRNIGTIFDDNTIIDNSVILQLKKMVAASDNHHLKKDKGIITASFVKYSTSTRYQKFEGQDFTLISRETIGQYPPYQKVIPQDLQDTIIFNPDTIKNIPINLLNKATKQIMIELKNKKVSFIVENMDIPAPVIIKDIGTTSYNLMKPKYIALHAHNLQALNKFHGNIQLVLKIPTEKSMCTTLVASDDNKLALIMPVKLPENYKR